MHTYIYIYIHIYPCNPLRKARVARQLELNPWCIRTDASTLDTCTCQLALRRVWVVWGLGFRVSGFGPSSKPPSVSLSLALPPSLFLSLSISLSHSLSLALSVSVSLSRSLSARSRCLLTPSPVCYRGTSLRDSPPPKGHHRAIGTVLQ